MLLYTNIWSKDSKLETEERSLFTDDFQEVMQRYADYAYIWRRDKYSYHGTLVYNPKTNECFFKDFGEEFNLWENSICE